MLKRLCLLIVGLFTVLTPGMALAQEEPITPQHTDPTWQAWYWNNIALAGPPTLQLNEDNLDHDWGSGSPAPGINADGFSARWTRYIDLPPGPYRFTATSDDGMRVWVDGALIIDEWYDHGAITVSADKTLSAGHHLVVVEYYENGGAAMARLAITPASAPIYNWRGEYFNNTSLSGAPSLVRDDTQIDFNWGYGSPAAGPLGVDRFSIRWTRTLDLPAGSYRFAITVDDGGRLWVNNHLLIDAWRDQAPATYTGDIYLPGGTIPLKMEYYENTAGAVARLSWTTGDTPPPPPPPSDSGWFGQYYNNPDLAGAPALTRVDADLNFDWGTGAPAANLPADNFSVRWRRDIYFKSGTYTFFGRHDDGLRMWVDGVLFIDSWYDQSATTRSKTLALSQGTHQFQVEYYERTGQASMAIWVNADRTGRPGRTGSPPSQGSEVIVDNTDAGFHWGGPLKARYTAPQGLGGSLYWTYNSTYDPVNYVKWTPRLPSAGKYEVFVYLPSDYGSSAGVRYRIIHDDWRHDRVISQDAYNDQWISLGTYGFNAANTGREFVLAYDNTGEPYTSRTIAFDAIKFVRR